MYQHEIISATYDKATYTQKKVCKLEELLTATNEKLDRFMKAVLTAVSQGSLDAATAAAILEGQVANGANLPLTTPSPIHFNNTSDNHNDDSDDEHELVEMTVGDEIRLETNQRPTRDDVLGDVEIVSPAAAATATSRNIGKKTKTSSESTKRKAAAGGMMESLRGTKQRRANGIAKIMKGAKVAASFSGLEDYNLRDIEVLLKEIMRKRLPVTALGEENPLKIEKGSSKSWSAKKCKLRRMLNFVTNTCITQEEFKCWSGGLPILEADVPQAVRDERNRRTDAVAKAVAGRCVTWWKTRGVKKTKEGKWPTCTAGSLQSKIDQLSETDKKPYDDMSQINNKKRMNATEAAAFAEEELEQEQE